MELAPHAGPDRSRFSRLRKIDSSEWRVSRSYSGTPSGMIRWPVIAISDPTALTQFSPSTPQNSATPEPSNSLGLFRWKLSWFFSIPTGFPRRSKRKKFKVATARFGPVRFQLPYSGEIGGGGSRSAEPVASATPPPVKDIMAVNVFPPWLIRSIVRIHDPSM